MPVTVVPLNSNDRTSASGLKLVEASGLRVPSQPAVQTVPVPTEKVSLHKAATELNDAAQAEISKLKARDTQVHQHEQAHLSAAAGLDVSNASFTYQRGPNGINYAVAGEVKIDTSPGRTPEETLARAEMIQNAALAPSDPSPADRSVAAKAQNMASQARAELLNEQHHVNESKHTEQQHTVKQAYDSNKAPSSPPHINTYA